MTECERLIANGTFTRDFFKPEVRCDFLVDEKRKKIWAIELDLLLQFDRVCRKYGLRYFLLVGSILGAIRHRGIIPWDDDIDVGMLRKDYDKFIKLKDEFCDPYFLQVPGGDGGYFMAFSKIRNSRTTALSKKLRYQVYNHGIGLDVFPMDEWDYFNGEAIYNRINKLCYDQGTYMRMTNPFLSREDIDRVARYEQRDPHDVQDEIDRLAHSYCGRNTGYVAQDTCSVYGFKRNIYPVEDFSAEIMRDFEGYKFPIPIGYEHILTTVYGDYMRFPPRDQRGVWHGDMIMEPDVPYKKYLKDNYQIG